MPTTRGPYLEGTSLSFKEAGKANDQHARDSVYSPVEKERRVHRVDSQEGRGGRADRAQISGGRRPVAQASREEAARVSDRRVRAGDRAVARRGPRDMA